MTPEDTAPRGETAEVEEVNARFYRALEGRDIEEMDRVWAHSEHARCVHPGWALLAGWPAIRESWEAIFRDSRELSFTIGHVVAHVDGDAAWLTCTEHLLTQAGGDISVTTLLATNLFERRGGEWRMIHHHASHILGGAPPPDA
jgi:ketosteroid isomerase-like protein